MAAQARKLLPALAAVGGAEKRRIFNSRVHRVRIAERWLQMPHALELPRMLRAVVPLVRGQRLAGFAGGVVEEAVGRLVREAGHLGLAGLEAGLVPSLAAIIGALDELPEPPAILRHVHAVGIGFGAFHVVDLPAREEWPAHLPVFSLAVRGENERTFTRSHQHPHTAHGDLLCC
jgi:hypothetical protein